MAVFSQCTPLSQIPLFHCLSQIVQGSHTSQSSPTEGTGGGHDRSVLKEYDIVVIWYPLTCIQALWLKAKLIAWVMSVTGLGKVVSDQNPLGWGTLEKYYRSLLLLC